MICALISPTFSWTRSIQSFLPLRIAWRASFTQSGHNESVVRGQPSVGFDFSHDLRSGLSDHFGVNDGFGAFILSKNFTVLNAAAAVLQIVQSTDFHIRLPTVIDIVLCISSVWLGELFVFPRRPRGTAKTEMLVNDYGTRVCLGSRAPSSPLHSKVHIGG